MEKYISITGLLSSLVSRLGSDFIVGRPSRTFSALTLFLSSSALPIYLAASQAVELYVADVSARCDFIYHSLCLQFALVASRMSPMIFDDAGRYAGIVGVESTRRNDKNARKRGEECLAAFDRNDWTGSVQE
jgi:hypothetical protein